MNLILASSSPRRRELLSRMEIPFEIEPAGIAETKIRGEDTSTAVLRLSGEKADAVAKNHPADLVVGADTVVELDGRMLGKPKDATEAGQMLQELSGKTHKVLTGVTLICHDEKHRSSFLELTEVSFHHIDREDIYYYVSQHAPLDKAGAYGNQDWRGVFVSGIKGCYHNVMGFPLARFHQHLKSAGLFASIQTINNL